MTEEKNRVEGGTLYLVTTPIGNLQDLSPRAIKVLSEVDFVAAEDTRNSLKLLTCFDIRAELISYHEHNKKQSGERILARLSAGESCALITDAGMPAISDPGEDLVRLCADAGIKVVVVPGPCACVSALSLSALSSRRFAFTSAPDFDGILPICCELWCACLNTCCLCFIFRLFHQRKESRDIWTSDLRPRLVFSGFPVYKGKFSIQTQPGSTARSQRGH